MMKFLLKRLVFFLYPKNLLKNSEIIIFLIFLIIGLKLSLKISFLTNLRLIISKIKNIFGSRNFFENFLDNKKMLTEG